MPGEGVKIAREGRYEYIGTTNGSILRFRYRLNPTSKYNTLESDVDRLRFTVLAISAILFRYLPLCIFHTTGTSTLLLCTADAPLRISNVVTPVLVFCTVSSALELSTGQKPAQYIVCGWSFAGFFWCGVVLMFSFAFSDCVHAAVVTDCW